MPAGLANWTGLADAGEARGRAWLTPARPVPYSCKYSRSRRVCARLTGISVVFGSFIFSR